MRNHATHLAPPRIKEQKKNNKNPFSSSFFTFFVCGTKYFTITSDLWWQMWPIAKNGGKLGTAVLQWGGVTNGSSPMLTVFNDWVVSAFSTTC